MSELDDLTKKLSEYAGREGDEHSLLPRVLLALVKSGSRSEAEITKFSEELARELKSTRSLIEQNGKETADSIVESSSRAESAASERHKTLTAEFARESKSTQSLIEQNGKETTASIVESSSRAESAASERHKGLVAELSENKATLAKSESAATERHNKSIKELEAMQSDIGKLRKIVIWSGIILSVAVPVVLVVILMALR